MAPGEAIDRGDKFGAYGRRVHARAQLLRPRDVRPRGVPGHGHPRERHVLVVDVDGGCGEAFLLGRGSEAIGAFFVAEAHDPLQKLRPRDAGRIDTSLRIASKILAKARAEIGVARLRKQLTADVGGPLQVLERRNKLLQPSHFLFLWV